MMTSKENMTEQWKFHACVGYTLVILCVGLPVWWSSTTVDRANLPYDEISDLPDPQFTMSILMVSKDADGRHSIGPKLQGALSKSKLVEVSFRSRVRTSQENEAYTNSKSIDSLESRLRELHPSLPSTVLFEAPSKFFADDKIIVLGKGRMIFFKEDSSDAFLVKSINEVIGLDLIDNIGTAIIKPAEDRNPDWTLRRPTASPSFDVLFSLMIPEPDQFKPNWNIEKSIELYFQPMLDSISELYDVSLKSQVLYLTSLNLKPSRQSNGQFFVSQKELGLAVNTGSQFSSHVSSRQTLNFIVYIPSSKNSPLHVQDNEGKVAPTNAFLVPRWGGVLIHNTNQTELNMKQIMSVFGSHFKSLIGLNHYETSLVTRNGKEFISALEKDFLIRLGCAENLAVSKMTLQSLSHLLTKISNIVINDEVSQQVYSAVDNYKKALTHAEKGDMKEAFEHSKLSVISSEKAFFDDRLLALLYFPEDQKYAIYIPLFLPISISYFGSLWTFLMALRSNYFHR